MSVSWPRTPAIYLYVALQAVAARITLGDLTLYTQAAQQVSSSFQGFLGGISSTYENNLFVGTLFDFLEYEPKIVSPDKPMTDQRTTAGSQGLSVEFRNVSFHLSGQERTGPAKMSASRLRRVRQSPWLAATERARRRSSSC